MAYSIFVTYAKQRICDNTLDDAQLTTRCPLENVRCSAMTTNPPRYSVGQLDQLPAELLIRSWYTLISRR